jgi:hypothetical protein
MSEDAVQKYAEELIREVEEGLDEIPFSEEVFTRLILERLEDAGHLESTFPLYQEGRIRNASYRIDGYAFDEERSRLDLYTTIYSGDLPPNRVPAADVTRAFERALRFVAACVDGLAGQLEPSNSDAADLARLIESQIDEIVTIRIVLLTNGIVGNIAESAPWRGREIECDSYDIVRLQRILGAGETRADITVDIESLTGSPLQSLHIPSPDGAYEAFLAVLPGEALSKIYERYGVRLLELNVRAFLGIQGRKSVNAELRRTIAEQPSMFLAYNNGLVATVDDIEVVTSVDERYVLIRKLHGLQIVNGGQTTASLHRARRKESLSLADVGVPIKIIKVGGADLAEMVTSISRAANRQNTVQLADFSANDPFHQQVETLANNTWLDDGRSRWFYERARGSYLAAEQKASYRASERQAFRSQTPKHRRLNKLDVARYLTAWTGLPYRVCLGGQKNFQHFMQRLKESSPPLPDTAWFKRLIALTVLYRAIEKKIRSMKFPAYRAQITAYLFSALAHRTGGRIDFDLIWSRQTVSPQLLAMIEVWAQQIDTALRKTAGQRNPSEWFKKEECWRELLNSLPNLTEPLPPELSYGGQTDGATSAAPTQAHSIADYERIERCMQIGSGTWLEVAELGQRAGLIHWKVAGICRTLASYAAGGWERKPSVKQARPALEAFLAVEKAGLLKTEPSAIL